MNLFARDGHLLELSLERQQAQDLSAEEEKQLQQHLQGCEACKARAAAVAEPLSLPPLPAEKPRPALRLLPGGRVPGAPPPEAPAAPPVEAAPPRSRRVWWAVPAVAMAAGILLTVLFSPDQFTRRGGTDLVLEVYKNTGNANGMGVSQRLQSGDTVASGDQIGFRIRSDVDGYLLISGRDGKGNIYACYPQDLGAVAVPVLGGPDAVALAAAVQLDGTPGEEQITATRCPRTLGFPDLANLPQGCVQTTVSLHKLTQ